MLTALLLLALTSPGGPDPTPKPTSTPAPTARPAAAPSPTARPALSHATPAAARPVGLSSYAGKVKVDRGKADALFRQDGPLPTATPAPVDPADPADPTSPKTALAAREASPSSEEAGWRSRAESARRALEQAREARARADRDLPPDSKSSQGTAQREMLLYRHQVRIDQAQAAVDALADECRQSPSCQPGWVR